MNEEQLKKKYHLKSLVMANLSRADLSEADLSEADLSGADLSEANLSGADLSKANLSWANLFGANLSRADLTKANLSEANLSEADLTGADIDFSSWPLWCGTAHSNIIVDKKLAAQLRYHAIIVTQNFLPATNREKNFIKKHFHKYDQVEKLK